VRQFCTRNFVPGLSFKVLDQQTQKICRLYFLKPFRISGCKIKPHPIEPTPLSCFEALIASDGASCDRHQRAQLFLSFFLGWRRPNLITVVASSRPQHDAGAAAGKFERESALEDWPMFGLNGASESSVERYV